MIIYNDRVLRFLKNNSKERLGYENDVYNMQLAINRLQSIFRDYYNLSSEEQKAVSEAEKNR
jgi:hypothetical protein